MDTLITLLNGFGTQTPVLAPGASENADFADSERKKSALVCVHLRPVKVKEGVAH